MSRVVFECLAAGRPLIASRVGVVPEVLADGEHAALVPAGDAEALADALAEARERPRGARAAGRGRAAAGRTAVLGRPRGGRARGAVRSLLAAGAV